MRYKQPGKFYLSNVPLSLILVSALLMLTTPFTDTGIKLHWVVYGLGSLVFIACSAGLKGYFAIPKSAILLLGAYGLTVGVSAAYSDLAGIGKYLFTLVLGGLVLLGWPDLLQQKDLMRRAVTIVLTVHILIFSLQWSVFLSLGSIIDIHQLIFPFSGESVSTAYGAIPRFGGLTQEPGSLANVLAVLISLYLLLGGRHLALILVTCAGLLLTRSSSGVLFAVVLGLTIPFLRGRASYKTALLILTLCVFAATTSVWQGLITNRYLEPLEANEALDGSTTVKLANIRDIVERPAHYMFFGYGFERNLCGNCLFINSGGNLVYFVFYSGIWGLLFVGLVVWKTAGKSNLRMIFPVFVFLTTRFNPDFPLFWLLAYALVMLNGVRTQETRLLSNKSKIVFNEPYLEHVYRP